MARASLLLLPCLALAAEYSACTPDASLSLSREAVGGALDDGALLAQGCPTAVDEEVCLCGSLRLGYTNATSTFLRARMVRREPAPALRRLAQAQHAGSVAVLARLHPKYPRHLKIAPAMEWAQSDEMLLIRIRYARYARGEALVQSTEQLELLFNDASLYLAAEGDERPAFFQSTLEWAGLLKRFDGCGDTEPSCAKWAADGSCDAPPDPPDAPPLSERCARSCGLCPAANGSTAVDGTWAAVPGGLVFEARKADKELWERPLNTRFPPNRIDKVSDGITVGALMACAETCRGNAPEQCAASDSPAKSWWNTRAAVKLDEGCVETCRRQCERELGKGYAVG